MSRHPKPNQASAAPPDSGDGIPSEAVVHLVTAPQFSPALIGIADAVRLTGIGRSTLYKLVGQKELRPVKIGRRTLFRADELAAWVKGLPRLDGVGANLRLDRTGDDRG